MVSLTAVWVCPAQISDLRRRSLNSPGHYNTEPFFKPDQVFGNYKYYPQATSVNIFMTRINILKSE